MYVYMYVRLFVVSLSRPIFAKVWKQNVYKNITYATSTNSSGASSFDKFISEKKNGVKIGLFERKNVDLKERERERERERETDRQTDREKHLNLWPDFDCNLV